MTILTLYRLLFWSVVIFIKTAIGVGPALDSAKSTPINQSIKTSKYLSTTDVEIDVLFDLYNSTRGWNWKWATGSEAAPKWSFNESQQQDPCAEYSDSTSSIMAWQGITCSSSPAICYTDGATCAITNLTLGNYEVFIIIFHVTTQFFKSFINLSVGFLFIYY